MGLLGDVSGKVLLRRDGDGGEREDVPLEFFDFRVVGHLVHVLVTVASLWGLEELPCDGKNGHDRLRRAVLGVC